MQAEQAEEPAEERGASGMCQRIRRLSFCEGTCLDASEDQKYALCFLVRVPFLGAFKGETTGKKLSINNEMVEENPNRIWALKCAPACGEKPQRFF